MVHYLEVEHIYNLQGKWLKSIDLPSVPLSDNYLILQDEQTNNTRTYVLKYDAEKLIMKINNVDDYFRLMNEAFVALFGTNTLKSRNFSKVIFYHENVGCLPTLEFPTDDDDDNNHNCEAIIYQYIKGPILRDYLKTSTVKDVKNIYHQLIKALYDAYLAIGFTHYDLHLRNVIVVLEPEIYPVIIDYGTSHITYEGKDYGDSIPNLSIEPRSYWVHDIIKLLLHTYVQINQDYVIEMTDYIIKGEEKKINQLNEQLQRDTEELNELEIKLQQSIDRNEPIGYRKMYQRIIDSKMKYIQSFNNQILVVENEIKRYQQRFEEFSDSKFYSPKEFVPVVIRLLQFVFPDRNISHKFVADLEVLNPWFPSPKTWDTDPLNTPEKFREFMSLVDQLFN